MVTSTHEASHRIFAKHPEALTPVFEALGVPPPTKSDIREITPDATEIRPLERRVDTVLKVEPPEGEHYLLAIEAQTKRAPDKATNWAYYVAYLRATYDLPVLLIVVCRDRPTADWAVGPFECGVGPWTTQVTRPFVLGPRTVSEITEPSTAARRPGLAVLSAIVHSDSRRSGAILDTVADGWRSFDKDTQAYWFETMEIALANTPAKAKWRELQMPVGSYYPGQGTLIEEKYLEGKADGKAEGKAKDRATLILRVLEKHGVNVPEDVRERITSCTDLDTLMLWFDRSLTAATAEDLFAEDEDGPAEGNQNQTSA
ncbi:hypothetical protein [Streptomyces mirabilis]|uniref:hypothetical protein n=1 Tax=Streptomyces mirabilis TaxID=68239 RepID=UPI0033200FEF